MPDLKICKAGYHMTVIYDCYLEDHMCVTCLSHLECDSEGFWGPLLSKRHNHFGCVAEVELQLS